MNRARQILVAGIGNIFFGDDAFGVEVVRALSKRPLPEGVQVIDFGIRSYDLACALTGDYDGVILVDAAPRGDVPGTVYVIEPEVADSRGVGVASPEGHGMSVEGAIQMARALGPIRARVILVGCEPAVFDFEGGGMELSAAVRAAVPRAVEAIEALVRGSMGLETRTVAGLAPG